MPSSSFVGEESDGDSDIIIIKGPVGLFGGTGFLVCSVCLIFLLSGCGSSQQGEGTSMPVEESMVSESLPIPENSAVEEASESSAEEVEAPTELEPNTVPPGCTAELSELSVQRQLLVFRRWLRDQCVGRHVSIENVRAECGNQEGFLVIDLLLSGPAGGLQSLGRALPAYYPGSLWMVTEYDRIDGGELSLRVNVEVRVPTGAQPRPRCSWDHEMTCGDDL